MAKNLTIADLKPDATNRRARTQRGARMLVESLEQLGPARSIVIDEDNEVLAGNGVLEAAAEAGITKLQIVETDGKTLVAVRRSGLSAADKRALALYDNRTAEFAEWVPEQLAADRADGLSLLPWFNDPEQRRLLNEGKGQQPVVKEIETNPVADRFWIAIRGPLKLQATALQKLRELLKDHADINVELGLTPEVTAWNPVEPPPHG
jgi:hypothetical protein